MKSKIFASIALASACATNAVTVSSVTARQRWPWNSMMDIDFTLADTSAPTANYLVQVTATYAEGTESVIAKTFVNEPVFTNGTHRLIWNLGKDIPNVKANDFVVTVTATPYAESTGSYLVFDLSGGSMAKSYPHWYTSTPPEVLPNTAQACKTTEMWFRRVPAGTITQGNGETGTANSLPAHQVTISGDYYVAIFETTQQQWYQIFGEWKGSWSNGVRRGRWRRSTRRMTCLTTEQFVGTGLLTMHKLRLMRQGIVLSAFCGARPDLDELIFRRKRSGSMPAAQELLANGILINRLQNLHVVVLRTVNFLLPPMKTDQQTVRQWWGRMNRIRGDCTTCTETCLKSVLTAGKKFRRT